MSFLKSKAMTVDYRTTVFLPKTDFPMKGGLPDLEPRLLARWTAIDLFGRLREQGKSREKFVLHDGPPYANGHLHIGHALNKILKDVINRCQQMLGFDANYVPGWDCHGLPIEWKIEEKYREAGLDKDAVDPIEFRRECREFAEHWIDVQRAEFQRLGVLGDWAHPYTTMAYAAEAQIVARTRNVRDERRPLPGAKPVLWSVVEKTALAEAEVEYHDHNSVTIWVRFPVARRPAGVGRGFGGDLDHHALDHAGQSRGRLWTGHDLPRVSRRRSGRRQPGGAGRAPGPSTRTFAGQVMADAKVTALPAGGDFAGGPISPGTFLVIPWRDIRKPRADTPFRCRCCPATS